MKKGIPEPFVKDGKLFTPINSFKGYIGNRGLPVTPRFIWKLIKKGAFPFEVVATQGRRWVVTEIDEAEKQ